MLKLQMMSSLIYITCICLKYFLKNKLLYNLLSCCANEREIKTIKNGNNGRVIIQFFSHICIPRMEHHAPNP